MPLRIGSLALVLLATHAGADSARQRILMDSGWRFHRGEIAGVSLDAPNGGTSKCMVLAGTVDIPGTLELTATADGLKSATVKLESAK